MRRSRKGAILIIFMMLSSMIFLEKYDNYLVSVENKNLSVLTPSTGRLLGNILPERPRMRDLLSLKSPKDIVMELRFGNILFTKQDGNAIEPWLPNCISMVTGEGYILPVNITTLELPYNAYNINISVETSEYSIINIPGKIRKAEKPRTLFFGANMSNIKYEENLEALLNYEIHSGIDPSTLTRHKYLVVRLKPLELLNDNSARLYRYIRLRIRYTEQKNLRILADNNFDVLILSSKNLSQAVEKLQKMKEKDGLRTKIAYVEDIYDLYSGQELDKPAMIREYINNTVRSNNIKFVIIFGDDDVVPVRYVYIPDGAYDNNPEIDGKEVETDLYYADLDFSWDDNGDNKWGDLLYDKVDGYPDVIVGRIPVSNITEALGIVNKIARYKPSKPLYSRVLFAGTDTFMIGYPEGEYLLEYSQKFVKDADVVKIYETYGNLTRTSFIREMDKGYALVAFTGHGLPDSLALSFSQTYSIGDANNQINKVLPVFVALSCDAGRFAGIDGIGEALVVNPDGGAIAYIGSTRIAWGYIGELVTTGLMGEMLWRTIKAYFNDTIRHYLGSIWTQVIKEYIATNPIYTNLAGYYIDWKTVAEFVLLGDPTLSLIPIDKEIVQSSGMSIINNATQIANKTMMFNGGIEIYNGTLTINNSVLILNNTSIYAYNSTLIIENSIIQWGDIIANSSMIFVKNSTIGTTTEMTNSSLNMTFSMITRAEISDTNSTVDMNRSSLLIVLDNISFTITNFIAGMHEAFNLSNIGLRGYAYSSYIGLSIIAKNASLLLENSTIEDIIAHNTEIDVINGTIGKIALNASTLNVSDSSVGIELYVASETINTRLELGKYTSEELDLGKSTIIMKNTNINYWAIEARSSSLVLEKSKISMIDCYDSSVEFHNVTVLSVHSENSDMKINASNILYVGGSGNISVTLSNIMEIKISGNVNISQNSRLSVLHLLSSLAHLNQTRIYHVYAEEKSNVSVFNSTIVTMIILDTSEYNATKTRIAVLDCKDNSSVYLTNTDVLYWLRIYDNATVSAEGGKIWVGLVFDNKKSEIAGLSTGIIDHKTIVSDWNITLRNVKVIGWDIIAYDSNITVDDSSLGWVYLFYNSNMELNDVSALLLRATHNSHVVAHTAVINNAYISGNADASISNTYIDSLYALGRSNVDISNSTFSIIAGMGVDAKIKIDKSYGGYVAAIENVSINTYSSKFTLYLSFSDIKYTFSKYYPRYYTLWNSSNVFGFSTNWKVEAQSSWISWALDFENSNITVTSSFLSDLYAMNSNVTIIDTKVVEFFVAYGSKVQLKSSGIYGIDLIWDTEINIESAVAPALYLVDSKLVSKDSLVGIILYLMDGTHNGTLEPGYYYNASLDDFFNTSSKIEIRLINSSVYGWVVFGVGISGVVNISVRDSKLLGVGAAYNASLDVEDTFVYGYTEIMYGVYGKPKITLENVATRLYVFLQEVEEGLVLNGIDKIEWNYDGQLLDNVVLNNVTIFEMNLDAYYSNVVVNKSVIEDLNIEVSNLTVRNSKISTLSTYEANCSISESNISTFYDTASTIAIVQSEINRFRPIGSNVIINNSSLGLDIALTFSGLHVWNLTPKYFSDAELYIDIPVPAYGSLRDVKIKGWFITLGEFSYAVIEDSKILCVSLSGHNSFLEVKSSNVDSVVLAGGGFEANGSEIGLEIHAEDIVANIRNIRKITYNETDSQTLFGNNPIWNVKMINTKITGVNITSEASKITINDSDVDYGIFDTSIVNINNVKAISIISRIITSTTIKNSWARLVNVGIGGSMQVMNSKVGLVDMYIYGNVEATPNKSKDQEIHNKQSGSHLYIMGSEIFDWSILAGYVSNVTVRNSKVFTASADGIAKLWLIDVYLEYPIEAYDLGEIHVVFSVEVNVIYDFMKPNKASIKIEGENTSIEATAEDGYYKTMLHQAIVRSYERIDLGDYKITASVGIFSSTKQIYVWKSLKVKIYIYGPITMGLVGAIIAAVIYLIFYKQEWIKEKMGKLKKQSQSEEEQYTNILST